jgi:biotin carboxylase
MPPDAPDGGQPRVLVLATAHSYRLRPFQAAADCLAVELVHGLDTPPAHVGAGQTVLRLDFRDVARSARQVRDYSKTRPFKAIIPTDDATVTLAAHLAAALGLRHNSPAAAEAARDKHLMRRMLAQARVPTPWFQLLSTGEPPTTAAAKVRYPCVLKPTCLAGSRGVIRADNPTQFVAAFTRLQAILAPLAATEILVEGYIPGREFALEGLLCDGNLKVLALFDKPDPLEGPYFEETIYVTPSREDSATQADIARCVAEAAEALGLREGAIHGEVRVNAQGSWLIEVAGRSIGGLCGQTLRFAHSAVVSLEELILRQALGWDLERLEREPLAGGVMMLPIPAAGILSGWDGLAAARAIPGIESVEITARLNYPLVPLPEGESYLGFIFARAPTPAGVETALRSAHRCLRFQIEPALTMAGHPVPAAT